MVLICEHASAFIPDHFNHLGLPEKHRLSHVVWDPGAIGVARHLSSKIDAALVAGTVSRLVYDCNRPPDAPDAMPSRSELIDIPGNAQLSEEDRDQRVTAYYLPFRRAVAAQISKVATPIIVTIHSFTPVYNGTRRSVEFGILHDRDSRLADAMLTCATDHTHAKVERNQPYTAEHGVMHTLTEHATPYGHLNVMLEIRNDLIATQADQIEIADMLAAWLQNAIAQIKDEAACQV